MPHIIVEYSDNLKFDEAHLLKDLHTNLAGQDTVSYAAITARLLPVADCSVGEPTSPNAFMHIALKLLPGRDDALRKQMAQALQDTARNHITDTSINISVETIELHQPSYTK